MAIDLPTSTEVAYRKFVTDMSSWRARLDRLLDRLNDDNGNPGDQLLVDYVRLRALRTYLSDFILLPGLNAVAQAEEEDPTYDCVAEATSTITALTAAIAWVDANFPTAGGYIQNQEILDGVVTVRLFTPNQVQNVPAPGNGFVDQIQAVRDTMSG